MSISKKAKMIAGSSILFILLTQFIQKCYPILDNYFIGFLGLPALLIHNMAIVFFSIAPYISYATATACLILWRHDQDTVHDDHYFFSFFIFAILGSLICMIPIWIFLPNLIQHFHVEPMYLVSAQHYLLLGLILTILFSGFYYITYVNNGIQKCRSAFGWSSVVLILWGVINAIGVREFSNLSQSLLFMMWMKIGFMIFVVMLFFYFSCRKISVRKIFSIPKIGYRIVFSELVSGMVTVLYPIIFALQLAMVDKQHSLMVSYQLILQLTVILCAPLMCAMQANLAQASMCDGRIKGEHWWKSVLFTGFLPTLILLLGCLVFYKTLFLSLYHYKLPRSHDIYIVLFIIATMIGQIGNMGVMILRARKKSHLVTVLYIISDFVFLIGLVQLFILLKVQSPLMVGVATLIYTIAYNVLAFYFCMENKKMLTRFIHFISIGRDKIYGHAIYHRTHFFIYGLRNITGWLRGWIPILLGKVDYEHNHYRPLIVGWRTQFHLEPRAKVILTNSRGGSLIHLI